MKPRRKSKTPTNIFVAKLLIAFGATAAILRFIQVFINT